MSKVNIDEPIDAVAAKIAADEDKLEAGRLAAGAMVVDGEIVVRPMMYLALSYDHRLIDGQEAVRFLVTIKEMIEDPARILLEL